MILSRARCCRRALGHVLFCIGLLQSNGATSQPRFENVTEDAIPFRLFEAMGMSFGDYNNDGWPDLFLAEALNFLANGGDRVALLHNGGNGRFVHRPGALPTGPLDYDQRSIHGETFGPAVFGDYDRDGNLDLYLPLGQHWLHRRGPNKLLRNDRGVYIDASSEGGLTEELSSGGAIWLDYDRDGFLDLYVNNGALVRGNLLSTVFEVGDPSAYSRLYPQQPGWKLHRRGCRRRIAGTLAARAQCGTRSQRR